MREIDLLLLDEYLKRSTPRKIRKQGMAILRWRTLIRKGRLALTRSFHPTESNR
jgi:hypothetical protein